MSVESTPRERWNPLRGVARKVRNSRADKYEKKVESKREQALAKADTYRQKWETAMFKQGLHREDKKRREKFAAAVDVYAQKWNEATRKAKLYGQQLAELRSQNTHASTDLPSDAEAEQGQRRLSIQSHHKYPVAEEIYSLSDMDHGDMNDGDMNDGAMNDGDMGNGVMESEELTGQTQSALQLALQERIARRAASPHAAARIESEGQD